MNRSALGRTLALGAISGMRGATKNPSFGTRVEPGPLAECALMGAAAGAAVAFDEHESLLLGGLVGAAAAVAAAHLAFHARRKLRASTALGGMIEDAVVMGLAAGAARLR